MIILLLKKILDSSEAWAVLIPLCVLLRYPKQPAFLTPVIGYLFVALLLNSFQVLISFFKVTYHFPQWMQSNNYVYNIISIVRFIFFNAFFLRLQQPFLVRIKKVITWLALAVIIINFIFFEKLVRERAFSSVLTSIESALLLFFCLCYYLYRMQEEEANWDKHADFWVVTGLSIYVTSNFFLFLFYNTLINKKYIPLAMNMWNFHNITNIIMCIFIAKAFYVSGRR
jgi:hypothetical protein